MIIKNHIDEARNSVAKYSVTRHLRKLEKLGKLEFRNLRSKQEILPHIDAFFSQHIQRYRLKNQASQFTDAANKEFYVDLVERFDHNGWIIFSVLTLDDVVVAYRLGFDYDNKLIWYKPAFDVEYRAYSPGTIMLKKLIEYSIETGHSELDFTIGDEAFKSRFSNRTRYNQNIAIYRSRLVLLAYVARHYLGFFFQRICKIIRKTKC